MFAYIDISHYPNLVDFPYSEEEYDEEEIPLICPFCQYKSWENLQIIDYVDIPMIWCNECEARSVLLMDKSAKEKIGEKTFLKVPLAKILRVCNYELEFFESKIKVPDEDVRKLYSSEREDIIKKYNIKKIDEDEHWGDKGFSPDENLLFNVSLPVNSYNVSNPEFSYPKEFDQRHDGVYVYLICSDLEGKEFMMAYWGD